jgi:hypothetical protein
MPLTLQEFNDNFTVTVVHFDNATNNASVHFKVQCNNNDRMSIHKATLDTTQLQPGYTTQDVISYAWESVKDVVNVWASFNLAQDRLLELEVISTSNSIDVTTFNTYFKVNLVKFELVPQIHPVNWCIEFLVCIRENESICERFEALLPITENYCNNTLCTDIAYAVWELVKEHASQWAAEKMPFYNVLNFVPTII